MRYHPLTRNNEFARAYTRGKSFVHPHVVLYVNKIVWAARAWA